MTESKVNIKINSLPHILVCFFISVIFMFGLSACSVATAQNRNKTVNINGYKINSSYQTISDDAHDYIYTYYLENNKFNFSIKYPDGSNFYGSREGGMAIHGWSEDYDSNRYANGAELGKALDVFYNKNSPDNIIPYIMIAFSILMSLIIAIFPYKVWEIRNFFSAWQYDNQDLEPSDTYILLSRITAIILIICSISLLFTLIRR